MYTYFIPYFPSPPLFFFFFALIISANLLGNIWKPHTVIFPSLSTAQFCISVNLMSFAVGNSLLLSGFAFKVCEADRASSVMN